jgi:uroporphyrin-III C-methyltransferase
MRMNQKIQIQKVIFAGAGPGDPELLTLKAVRYLKDAEVVITDRLVSDAILNNFVSPKTLVLHAGKQRRKEGSTPQRIINELLVEYALQGKKVVRLKGGDVSIFSNLLDELEALKKYGIPYEIIPGITAACGAAAYAGIPLTARNHAQAVRFLTLHKNEIISPDYWKALAHTEDTLVFYMSGETTPELVRQLLVNGIHPDTHIAVIEQATTPFQKVISGPMASFEKQFGEKEYVSPTLIIVGKVAALHETFRWMSEPERTDKLYFKPVTQKQQEEVRA